MWRIFIPAPFNLMFVENEYDCAVCKCKRCKGKTEKLHLFLEWVNLSYTKKHKIFHFFTNLSFLKLYAKLSGKLYLFTSFFLYFLQIFIKIPYFFKYDSRASAKCVQFAINIRILYCWNLLLNTENFLKKTSYGSYLYGGSNSIFSVFFSNESIPIYANFY